MGRTRIGRGGVGVVGQGGGGGVGVRGGVSVAIGRGGIDVTDRLVD